MRIEGVVFDLDATLINLGEFVEWKKAHNEIVEYYLSNNCDPEYVKDCSARGLFQMFERMFFHLKENDNENAYWIQNSAHEILARYEFAGTDSCVLMDGCLDILDWLKDEEIQLGICTSNSPESAERALKLQGIREYFSAVVGRTFNIPIKPHPAQLLKCFDLMKVDPIHGVMVGDSHKDIIAGKKIGAYTVGIPVHFTRLDLMKQAGVDVIIDNLSDLKEVLEAIQ